MSSRFSVRAAAVPESLELIHELLEDVWKAEPGIEFLDRIRFETALIEVASNIIEHSRPAGTDPVRFVLAVECEPKRLFAEFTDNARPAGIDLSGAELPDGMSASGRGLALAKVALDQFSYAKEDAGNRWTLLCRRNSAAAAQQ
ncbi:ATP-binding protein [Arthrobacter sp. ISL-72]|uniref:ATP-binding protein n=1 Tax=Arthrobacter sp. ISL-72 TaxID=2819114 RepID=UPI001BEB864D|nr:ATP-binding protein [Arthrobacter sp. ISL-72]MBT2597612.1 ATP-binding protein [Arthrobacter sp. ISL-72]